MRVYRNITIHLIIFYMEKLLWQYIYVISYNDNSKKYKESRENRDAMVITTSGMNIVSS